jgi:hypothetical protein
MWPLSVRVVSRFLEPYCNLADDAYLVVWCGDVAAARVPFALVNTDEPMVVDVAVTGLRFAPLALAAGAGVAVSLRNGGRLLEGGSPENRLTVTIHAVTSRV